MNYIKRLQAENAELRRLDWVRQNVNNDIRVYLTSEKFHNDTTVQVADVLNRMADLENHYRILSEDQCN